MSELDTLRERCKQTIAGFILASGGVTILALVLFVASPVAAQKSTDWHSWPTGGRFGMSAGLFNPDLDTTIVVTDADGIIGTGISFENNLGLDDSESTVLVDIDWRLF